MQRQFLRDVWWPAFGSFEELHPQYELRDAEGMPCRLDFAYLRPPFRMGVEVIGPSAQGASRTDRLSADLWIVLRFSIDDVKEDPVRCRRTLIGALDRLRREGASDGSLTPSEKEVVRLAARSVRPTNPADVMRALQVSDKTARALLKSLVHKRLLRPVGAARQRVRAYEPAVEPQLLLFMVP